MRRTLAVLVLCLVALSAVAPATGAAAMAGGSSPGEPIAPSLAAQEDPENTTDDTADESAAPTQAEKVRINPVSIEGEYQSVTVTERDSVYNTTGEFVLFSTTEPVDAARISQSKASAEVLEGGQTVKVTYEPDAAPDGEHSLYTLELFFEDGSSKDIELYAGATEQSVAAAELSKWEGTIEELQNLAEEWGYDTDPESVQEFLVFIDDQAHLVDGFITEKAAQTIAWLIAGVMNPLNIIIGLSIAALAMWRRRSKHGELADALSSMAGRYQQKLDRLEIGRHQAKRTADDEHLSEVPAIGTYSDYYEDAFGVKSPAQLAHLAASGEARATKDGLEKIHDGVDDLNTDDLHGTWLEPVLRHIPHERQVLNHLLETVKHMETEHQLGSLYRDTRNDLEVMLDDVERREMQLTGATPATGDD